MISEIQLRWAITGDGHEDDPVTRTLQFRTKLPEAWVTSSKWSAWLDVPEVEVNYK